MTALYEIIVDNFAGGGGASTGIELALGRPVDIAINHDPEAILMHRTNHPYTEHMQASVWDIDPVEVCGGRPVGLAWFSPDCKHFSKAKGGKPVEKKIRGLAWIALRWAGTVRPRVIILENVEEFQTWGPVRKGKPVKKMAGQTFRRFIRQLTDLGYTVEYRELIAADYGAPTIRKRFFLIARCDGQPIVWPEPTHSKDGSAGRPKWRSAAEIIDWTIPCPSIFETKAQIKARYGVAAVRPLADATLNRIACGTDKFTIKSAHPFIVPIGYGERIGQAPRVHDIQIPVPTVVGDGKHYITDPALIPFHMHNHQNAIGTDMREPANTATSTGSQIFLTPSIIKFRTGATGHDLDDPLHTITSGAGSKRPAGAAHTLGVITPSLMAIGQTGGGNRIRSAEEPVNTQVSKAESCLVAPSLIQYHSEQKKERVRGQAVNDTLMTVDAANRYGYAAAYMTEYFGNGKPIDITDPMHTVTAKDRENLTLAMLQEFHKTGVARNPNEPLTAQLSKDHAALTAAHVVKFKGDNLGQPADEPLQTVTSGGQHYGAVYTTIVKAEPGADLYRWPQVRALLNKYCGYSLADNEVILLWIGGVAYFIADIGLRMLTPRELYNAQGFPPDYIIEVDYSGKPYPKSAQVARCGNAVCPPLATALVKANFPERAVQYQIETMEQLKQLTAV